MSARRRGSAVRAAAEEAGKKFAACKAEARRRADMLAKVNEFAATPEAEALGEHEAHFVKELQRDFARSGLTLSAVNKNPRASRPEIASSAAA
mmetsp:Transcript_29290/g.68539  ORF Transcript_29290/g.68539 Transcript_29290/m.68539 type:complete len:93 (+) Transcript_29290:1-279(+)